MKDPSSKKQKARERRDGYKKKMLKTVETVFPFIAIPLIHYHVIELWKNVV